MRRGCCWPEESLKRSSVCRELFSQMVVRRRNLAALVKSSSGRHVYLGGGTATERASPSATGRLCISAENVLRFDGQRCFFGGWQVFRCSAPASVACESCRNLSSESTVRKRRQGVVTARGASGCVSRPSVRNAAVTLRRFFLFLQIQRTGGRMVVQGRRLSVRGEGSSPALRQQPLVSILPWRSCLHEMQER